VLVYNITVHGFVQDLIFGHLADVPYWGREVLLMYTKDEREQLRQEMIDRARGDQRIVGAAVTGSAALDSEDAWSDIDLAFGIDDGVGIEQPITEWTEFLYREHGAIHHLDVRSGAWHYRVFLLANTLQIDLAFVPVSQFGALAPSFRLVFGDVQELAGPQSRDAMGLIGWAWLYALHARSSIARGRLWQAEYMISGARDHVLALACFRHGLPTSEGRGFDRLPQDTSSPLSASLVRSLERYELSRAFSVVVEALLVEVREVDAGLADQLSPPLTELAGHK